MTFEVQATVTCDRCKTTEKVPSNAGYAYDSVTVNLPFEWLFVAVQWDTCDPSPKHLCERCRRGFEFWIEGMADAVTGDEVLDAIPVKPVVPPGPRPGPNPFVPPPEVTEEEREKERQSQSDKALQDLRQKLAGQPDVEATVEDSYW